MRRNEGSFPMRRDSGSALTRPDLFNDWSSGFGGSPWQMMRRMQEDMDRLFEQFLGSSGLQQGQQGTRVGTAQAGMQWTPSMDISSTPSEIRIEAEMPGVNKDDIDITVQNRHLILEAEMRQETGDDTGEERQYHHRERRYGFFKRVLPLPENVDEEHISCDFRNGVLCVRIPKHQQAGRNVRHIPIQDVNQLPSETASGRRRSQEELRGAETGGGAAGGQSQGRSSDVTLTQSTRAAGDDGSVHGMNSDRMEGADEHEPAIAGRKGGERRARSSATK